MYSNSKKKKDYRVEEEHVLVFSEQFYWVNNYVWGGTEESYCSSVQETPFSLLRRELDNSLDRVRRNADSWSQWHREL